MVAVSFALFLLLFVGIGLASVLRARHTRTDYYLASRAVPAWLAGLSAVATNNSGYMFIGVIGYTYLAGLSSIWLMLGWISGDMLGSLLIHRKLREQTAATGEASYAAVLARWQGQGFERWRRLAAVVMLVFLGAYAAAQISAGGKALQAVFAWDPRLSASAVAAMVLAYSAVGGIRASIWTDAAQSAVMFCAMAVLCYAAVEGIGGAGATVEALGAVPNYLDLFPDDLLLPGAAGAALFVLGWMFAGLSVIGQPHIMVRFMALDRPQHLNRARLWYYGYFTLFYGLATVAGLTSRLYLPDLAALDPELALPTMAIELLSAPLVGMILAGIFAATMSTADSLVLSCSAAVTHDLGRRLEATWQIKAVTAVVTLLALAIALAETRSVFELVLLSWSSLAAAFAPLLLVLVSGRRIEEHAAIAALLTGLAVVVVWRALGWHEMLYEGLPGILAGWLVAMLWSMPSAARSLEPSRPARRAI